MPNWATTFWWLLLSVTITHAQRNISCHYVEQRCKKDSFRCNEARLNMHISCERQLAGNPQCSDKCRSSLLSVGTTSSGSDLLEKCECGDQDSSCHQLKHVHHKICKQEPTKKKISCHIAEKICVKESACRTGLTYIQMHCASLLTGKVDTCTDDCKRTFDALHWTKSSFNLLNCYCNGEDQHVCLRQNKLQACKPPSGTSSISPSVFYLLAFYGLASIVTKLLTTAREKELRYEQQNHVEL